uniref:XRN2-binding (XTBD) domain-containing protein n=1 Tax=Piliocolobus tephrosceles TaxID=591936 RepID=A0A8C9LHV8_9PRIM
MVGGEVATVVEELVSGCSRCPTLWSSSAPIQRVRSNGRPTWNSSCATCPTTTTHPTAVAAWTSCCPFFMVWANHLFMGCSYNKDLLDKVMGMADGMEVEDLPQFTTRSELMKKHQR